MIRTLGNLIRAKRKGEFVLFLGAGTFLESGEPETEAIVKRIVRDFGDTSVAEEPERYTEFYRVLDNVIQNRMGRGDRQATFHRYFEHIGPSEGYMRIAELLKLGWFDIVLTTNFDNMLETAFVELRLSRGKDYDLFVVGRDRNDEIGYFLAKRRPRIKLIKLLGDLGAGILNFRPVERLEFPDQVRVGLKQLTTRNMILLGYGVRDRSMLRILSREGDAIWWAGSSEPSWDDPDQRDLLTLLLGRSSDKNLIVGQHGRFDGFAGRLFTQLVVIDWTEFRRAAQVQVASYFELRQDDCVADLLVHRSEAESVVTNFMGDKDRGGLILVGEAGTGKTCLICSTAENCISEGDLVLAFDCGRYIPDLEGLIKRGLGVSEGADFHDLLVTVNSAAASQGRQFLILFDGLNDHRFGDGPEGLLARIDGLVERYGHLGVKIVVSCGTAAWGRLEASEEVGFSWSRYYAGKPLALYRFDEDALGVAYGRYQRFYDLKTNLSELPEETIDALREPLILRLVSEAYTNREVPPEPFTPSVCEVFYGWTVPHECQGALVQLVGKMIGRESEVLWDYEVEELLGEQAFGKLRDAGVLAELPVGRPKGQIVRVKHKWFFEYLIADCYLRKHVSREIQLSGELLAALLEGSSSYPFLLKGVSNILVMSSLPFLYLDLIRLEPVESRDVVLASLESLSLDDRNMCRSTLQRLRNDGGEDMRDLLAVIEKQPWAENMRCW
jgi:hypothetical protein